MPGIVTNGDGVNDSTKPSHVSYTEVYYVPQPPIYDAEGNPTPQPDKRETEDGTTNAKITNSKVRSSGNVYSSGKAVTVQGDKTQENWAAEPPPQPKHGGTITNISPGLSGSGEGTVGLGSGNVFINGKKVSSKGTSVTTHLGINTTIKDGSTTVFIGTS